MVMEDSRIDEVSFDGLENIALPIMADTKVVGPR
jgi:hypothetical protein